MAEYPTTIYDPRIKANRAGVVYDPLKTTVGYAEDITKLDAEIIAIETELGINPIKQIILTIDGGSSVITTGVKTWIRVPKNCIITGWELTADQSGSIVLDIWKDTFANFPPTITDTITASAKPTLTSQQKNSNDTLTGWTTTIIKGDYLKFNVDSVSTITKVVLILKYS
ncbi:MAG: hypothetical protein V1768_02025 [Patescibacteria group bacterium]